ncbi:MAG: 1-(5-phosphoribosyl)-5-((5-phosphoribosylamino)methylideneamino)imidazole-4-carboxamide isomerase [Polyangiaceae bacterium]|nr:1-(5-phosphoribosyl)-5-((5-phosphoribosylamino)methylideneamino)imidazole-4-carboxamide isomerase [Polyangiaceae bacterium]
MRVIPAIDLLDGAAVRLRQGRYDAVTTYDRELGAIATEFRAHADRLHVVDLEGARSGQPTATKAIERIVRAFGPGVQVGGGIRSLESVETVLALADRVVLGTAAVRDPALVRRASELHPGRVILALDARDGRVAISGWEQQTGETVLELAARFASLPLGGILYTDIERDGTEVGPNVEATSSLARAATVEVIASGGVGTLAHLRALAAAPGPIAAAVVGRALHEGRFSLPEAVLAAASAQGGG